MAPTTAIGSFFIRHSSYTECAVQVPRTKAIAKCNIFVDRKTWMRESVRQATCTAFSFSFVQLYFYAGNCNLWTLHMAYAPSCSDASRQSTAATVKNNENVNSSSSATRRSRCRQKACESVRERNHFFIRLCLQQSESKAQRNGIGRTSTQCNFNVLNILWCDFVFTSDTEY